MNTLLIITKVKQYEYHHLLLPLLTTNIFSNALCIYTADISKYQSSISQQLADTNPDLIITLDLAGFELRTLTGECLLNMLPCKICNILWGDKPEYAEYLSGKLSLSMLFYDATGNDNQLPVKYPNMRYYYATPKAIPTAQDDVLTDSTIQSALQDILNHFKTEVLL